MWDNVFKSGPSKTCEIQPLKNLKGYASAYSWILDLILRYAPSVLSKFAQKLKKSVSSNLSVDRIHLIVAFKIWVLEALSKDASPKRKILVTAGSAYSNNFWSMSFRVLRRSYLSVVNVGQYSKKCEIDFTMKPQWHLGFKEFWKVFVNLCFCKWLSPRCSQVTNVIP